tara:strand:- start:683 stop:1012 length:330 start_codon:yes stop_codon:yes gene_type:complete
MLLLQLAELLSKDSGAPRVEIGVGHAPAIERPPLRHLPQLVGKVLHLRKEQAAAATAHAIGELDELVAARSASRALRPLDWPLARRDAATRSSRATPPPSLIWRRCAPS